MVQLYIINTWIYKFFFQVNHGELGKGILLLIKLDISLKVKVKSLSCVLLFATP